MPDCPPYDLMAVRNAHLVVRYDGEDDSGACLQRVGGVAQSEWLGIWPTRWPEGSVAAQAAHRVLAQPPGSRETFTASFEWVSNNFDESVVWRFTVCNQGMTTVMVAGRSRQAVTIGWDEQSLGHAYKAHAEYAKDLQTGTILSQSFHTLLGNSTTAEDFWSRYGGGPGAVADFTVTSIR